VRSWIKERGDAPGSLFRISGHGLWDVVRATAKRAGVGVVRPHGLRHSGITRALDVTNGNLRAVQQFSRHKNVNTLMIYDDNRRDYFGEIAEQISLSKPAQKK
jgi:integrase/recombinase XerC